MPLQAPKRLSSGGGFSLALEPPVKSPSLKMVGTAWQPTPEWYSWSEVQRKQLLGDLLSHGNWFSRPPRHDVIDPLFTPWIGKNVSGELRWGIALPASLPGTAVLTLRGLTMSATAIKPIWTVDDFDPEPEDDKISLFGDDDYEKDEKETREILIEDIESAAPAPPTHIRNRDWEAKKMFAKERVREARLKAQMSEHIARKEEARFYSLYGDLEDGESNFSEYDLSENGSVDSESEP